MPLVYVVHILAGSLGLLFGYVALFSAKGGSRHRQAGMLFVYVMLTMGIAGMLLAIVRNKAPTLNLPAALLTIYLVVTGLWTVRPPVRRGRGLAMGAMVIGLAVGLVSLAFGLDAVTGGNRDGMAAPPFFLFGTIGLIAGISDIRVVRHGALRGPARLARHLWRLCFALFIAAMSFFLGQAQVIPEPIRIMPVLMLPVLAVLVTMLYWLWRIRVRRSLRGVVTATAS